MNISQERYKNRIVSMGTEWKENWDGMASWKVVEQNGILGNRMVSWKDTRIGWYHGRLLE
jgi:hypothetical protein